MTTKTIAGSNTDALWPFSADVTYLLGLLALMFTSGAFGWALRSLQ